MVPATGWRPAALPAGTPSSRLSMVASAPPAGAGVGARQCRCHVAAPDAAVVHAAATWEVAQHISTVPSGPPRSSNAVPLPRNAALGTAAAAAAAAAAVAATAGVVFEAPAPPAALHQQQQQLRALVQGGLVVPRRSAPSSHEDAAAARDSTAGRADSAIGSMPAAQARQLTRAIMDAASVQQLRQLLRRAQPHGLNLIHVSAMLTRVARLAQEQRPAAATAGRGAAELQAFLQQLDQHAAQLLRAAHQQQQLLQRVPLAPPVGVLARAPSSSSSGSSRRQHTAVSPLAAQQQGREQQVLCMPQQLANMAWCHATLGCQPTGAWWSAYWAVSTPALSQFKPRELAAAIWAASKLHQAPPAAWMAAFETACVAGGALARAQPQELCMMLRGVAVLGLPPSAAWVACLQDAVLRLLPCMGPRDISQVLWGHARLALPPPRAWLHAVLGAAGQQAPRFSVRDTAMLLWALAALSPGRQPGRQACSHDRGQAQQQQRQHAAGDSSAEQQQQQQGLVAQLVGSLLLGRCKLRASTPQDYAHIMWALAVLEQRKQQDLGHTQRQPQHAGLSELQLQRWCGVTWQQVQPPGRPAAAAAAAAAAARGAARVCSAADVAQLLWAASQLGPAYHPPRGWLQQLWAASLTSAATSGGAAGLPPPLVAGALSAHSLTLIMWAALRLDAPPPWHWLAAALPLLQWRLAELQPAAACQLLVVLVRCGARPSPAFMQQLLSRLQLDAALLPPRALACVLWSLGRLRYVPAANWWAPLLGRLQGAVGALGARELSNVVWGLHALGLFGGDESAGAAAVALPRTLRAALLRRAEELGCCSETGSSGAVAADAREPHLGLARLLTLLAAAE